MKWFSVYQFYECHREGRWMLQTERDAHTLIDDNECFNFFYNTINHSIPLPWRIQIISLKIACIDYVCQFHSTFGNKMPNYEKKINCLVDEWSYELKSWRIKFHRYEKHYNYLSCMYSDDFCMSSWNLKCQMKPQISLIWCGVEGFIAILCRFLFSNRPSSFRNSSFLEETRRQPKIWNYV